MSVIVSIGIVSFKDQHYLVHGIPSLLKQIFSNIEILICDNNVQSPEISDWLKKKFPQIQVFCPGGNLGFGRAHNLLIDKAKGEFYLAFNSDMYADSYFVQRMVEVFEKDEKVACVTGKLLRWNNFPDLPKNFRGVSIIDTTGLVIERNHHVIDRGQGDEDHNQFNREEEVWGASGAAPMYRISALKDLAYAKGEYFDDDFFMYKEDVDLSYRLRWAGWKTVFVPDAVSWHDRTAYNAGGIIKTIRKRRSQSKIVRQQSFINQLLLIKKNFSRHYSGKTKLATGLFLLEYLIYVIIFEPVLLCQLKIYWKLRIKMKEKSASMPRRISPSAMEKWFQ